jgi:hypothetical protein
MHTLRFVYASDVVQALTKDTRMYQGVLVRILNHDFSQQYVSGPEFANVLENKLVEVSYPTSWPSIIKMIGVDNWVCLR